MMLSSSPKSPRESGGPGSAAAAAALLEPLPTLFAQHLSFSDAFKSATDVFHYERFFLRDLRTFSNLEWKNSVRS